MSQQSNHDQFLQGTALPRRVDFEACVCGAAYSLYISREEMIHTWNAINFANYCGYQLNVELTINWQTMGYTTWAAIDAAYSALMELMHKRIKGCRDQWGKSTPFYQYTVFEYAPTVGVHSHSGIHVPRKDFADFRRWLDRCVKRMNLTGAANVHYCPVPRYDPTTSQWKTFSYAMKGMNPSFTIHDYTRDGWRLGLTANYVLGIKQEYAGHIEFRRVRRSHAMSKRKQLATGYVPSVNILDGTTSERYSDVEFRRGKRDRDIALFEQIYRSTPVYL